MRVLVSVLTLSVWSTVVVVFSDKIVVPVTVTRFVVVSPGLLVTITVVVVVSVGSSDVVLVVVTTDSGVVSMISVTITVVVPKLVLSETVADDFVVVTVSSDFVNVTGDFVVLVVVSIGTVVD